MKVFIVNGSGGVGKDTFVNYVGKYIDARVVSMADISKWILNEIGWDGSKDEKSRKMLSDLKLLIDEFNDGNYRYVSDTIKVLENKEGAIFIMSREKKDIDRFVKDFGAVKILVIRNSVKHITSNVADANVFESKYDYIIENNGTISELNDKAEKFVKDFKLISK